MVLCVVVLFVVSCPLCVVSCLLVVDCRLLFIGCCLLIVVCCSLFVVCWVDSLLLVPCCVLVVRLCLLFVCWLLVVGFVVVWRLLLGECQLSGVVVFSRCVCNVLYALFVSCCLFRVGCCVLFVSCVRFLFGVVCCWSFVVCLLLCVVYGRYVINRRVSFVFFCWIVLVVRCSLLVGCCLMCGVRLCCMLFVVG